MGKWLNRIVVALIGAIVVLFVGCSAMMDGVTPCYIDEDAGTYAQEPNLTSFLPYTSLWDAKRIEARMEYAHTLNQLELLRLAEDDDITYSFLKGQHTINIKNAEEFRDTLFDPAGPIGLLLPLIGGGALGALLIPRPGDSKKLRELEVLKVNGNGK